MRWLRRLLVLALVFLLGFGLGAFSGRLREETNPPPVELIESLPSPTPSPTATPKPSPTEVPIATPSPVPTPTPRKPIEKVTKIGVGIYSRGGGHLIDMLFQAKPTVILLMDPDIEFAQEVRRWFPKALIVGRHFVPNKEQLYMDNPTARGQAFADRVAQLAIPLKGVVDAWMSYNEAVTLSSGVEALRAYNTFQVAFARRLQGTYGIAAVAGNEGAGALRPEDYVTYFADAIRESRYFGVHAYASRNAKSMMDDPQGSEWYALRYRKIHQALVAAGIRRKDEKYIILTETGLWQGWRGVTSEEAMARDILWLADETERDPCVIGQAVFGIFANGEDWRAFDIAGTSILDRLGDYWPAGRPPPTP